jgi:hypothetical protein
MERALLYRQRTVGLAQRISRRKDREDLSPLACTLHALYVPDRGDKVASSHMSRKQINKS